MSNAFDHSFEDLRVDTDLSSYSPRYRREVAETILNYGLDKNLSYAVEYTWDDPNPSEMILDSATLVEVVDGNDSRRVEIELNENGRIAGPLDDILYAPGVILPSGQKGMDHTLSDLLSEDANESLFYR